MSFFDGSQVDEKVLDSLGALPAGEYLASLETCEIKPGQADPNVAMFASEFQVVQGDFAGRKIFNNAIFRHPSKPRAAEIGQARMKQMVVALCGKDSISSPAEIQGKTCIITLEERKDRNGNMRAEVSGFRKAGTPPRQQTTDGVPF